jgi:hypothetical protein
MKIMHVKQGQMILATLNNSFEWKGHIINILLMLSIDSLFAQLNSQTHLIAFLVRSE